MKINVINITPYIYEVQASVTNDGYLEYCSHAHQDIEPVTTEYLSHPDDWANNYYTTENISICRKCGAGWNQDGEQCMEA
jgi:hypothetical protein